MSTLCGGGSGADDIFGATVGNVSSGVFGSAAEHSVSGGLGNDEIVSGIDAELDGVPSLQGGGGDDSILMVGGVSRLDGRVGNDTLAGTGAEVTMVGGFGADVFVIGSRGDDRRSDRSTFSCFRNSGLQAGVSMAGYRRVVKKRALYCGNPRERIRAVQCNVGA